MNKKCPKCQSLLIIKFWLKRWKQRYKCKSCNNLFQNNSRNNKKVVETLYEQYVFWKQTYKELGDKYWLSWRTIKRKIDITEFKKKILLLKKQFL